MNKNIPPVLFNEKSDCCGCSACFAICPNKAINMIADEEGFLYPCINLDKCCLCYLCLTVCPYKCNVAPEVSENPDLKE